MGTRNLTMVIDKKGELKIAQYGQWDGYPSGVGADVLEFAKDKDKLSQLEEQFNFMKFCNRVNDIERWIYEYNKRCENEFNTHMSDESRKLNGRNDKDIYWFDNTQSRDLGGKILDSIITLDKTRLPTEHNNTIYLFDDSGFGKESLFCEWAYCINLNTNKLECFKGFNTDKSKEHERFATKQEEVNIKFNYTDKKYYGITLIKEYDLDNLPTREKFIKELEQKEKDEE